MTLQTAENSNMVLSSASAENPNEWTTLRLDGGKLYAKVKTSYFLYLFTSLAAIGGFLFGYDTGVISGAIILIRKVGKMFISYYIIDNLSIVR